MSIRASSTDCGIIDLHMKLFEDVSRPCIVRLSPPSFPTGTHKSHLVTDTRPTAATPLMKMVVLIMNTTAACIITLVFPTCGGMMRKDLVRLIAIVSVFIVAVGATAATGARATTARTGA